MPNGGSDLGLGERAMVDQGSVDGLGFAEAIESLRDDLLRARAAGATSDIQLPVDSMTVELTVTATREVNGKAGFKVPPHEGW
jgi:hypothetical protein